MRVIGVEHVPFKTAFALEKAVESTKETIAIIGPKASGKTAIISEIYKMIKQNKVREPQIENAVLFLDGKIEQAHHTGYVPTIESDFLYMKTSRNREIGLYALGSTKTGFTQYLYDSIMMQPTIHKVVLIHNVNRPLEETKQFFIERLSKIKDYLHDKRFILVLIRGKDQKISENTITQIRNMFSKLITEICGRERDINLVLIESVNNHFEDQSLSEFFSRYVVGE